MTYAAETFSDLTAFQAPALRPGLFRKIVIGATVVGFGIVAGAWTITTLSAAWVVTASWMDGPAVNGKAAVENLHLYASLGRYREPRYSSAPASTSASLLSNSIIAPLDGLTSIARSPAPFGALAVTGRLKAPVAPSSSVIRGAGFARLAELMAIPQPVPRPVQPAANNLGQTAAAAPLPPLRPNAESAPSTLPPLPPRDPFRQRQAEAANQASRWPVRPILPAPAHSIARPESLAPAKAARYPSRMRMAAVAPEEAPAPAPRRARPRPAPVAAVAPPPDSRNPLQRFFDAFTQGPRSNVSPGSNFAASYGSRTAVYDIAAHTVYLPNGERLEAHSGLGALKDNPRYVFAKDRGPTPPHVYDLALRRRLFHGVQALRLNPVGGGAMYGRVGLLAHSYMLGPNGDSNGCLSFRQYPQFLRAYLSGQINRIVVVPHLGSQPGQRFASN